MTKVVIDTNVLVSALINEHGAEAAVFFAMSDGRLRWCVSPAVLAEYETVLHRPKFSSIPAELVTALLKRASASELVHPTASVNISPDEPDNRFYECAEAASAEYICTGNLKHFPKPYKSIQIVTARQLLGLLTARTD
jgi:putative PIN family toxin of toxin-antitoxin system